MTVADLITASFRRINVIAANAVPSPEDMADGFIRFKMMLGSWRLQRNTIPFIQRTTFTISSTKGTATNPYTVGSGGDVNTPRPPQPNALRWKYQDTSVSPTLEYPLGLLTDAAYQSLPQKNLTSPLPQLAYYNPTYSGSLGSLYLYPVATSTTLQGLLYAPASIQDPAATSTTLTVPDGYELALMDNLAVVLFPEWRENVSIDPMLVVSARDGKLWILTANLRMVELSTQAGVAVYDINSDLNVSVR